MKNYKNLIPIVLVVLFILGIYMKVDSNLDLDKEYNEYLTAARNYRDAEIYVDAEKNYLLATETNPSVELYVEIGEFYRLYNKRAAIKWGEETIETYPEETLGYEFLLTLYSDVGKYEDFYEVYNIAVKRGLETEKMASLQKELSAEYYFEGKYPYVGSFAGGYCMVYEDELWRFVNAQGVKVTGLNYAAVGNFCDGVAPVKDKLGEFYFIDVSGNKKLILENFENIVAIGSYDNELATVYDGKTWGVYSLDGDLKYGGFSNISSISNGVIAVEKNGKWNLLDEAGNQIINESFDDIKQDEKGIVYRNSRLFVEKNGKYYLIDKSGNTIVKTAFEDAKIFNGSGYAAVKVKDKWGFINQDGEIVIEPIYEDARSFSNKYAAVKKNGKWGFIDENNDVFIDYQFSDARDFTNQGSVFVNAGIWRLLRLYSYN